MGSSGRQPDEVARPDGTGLLAEAEPAGAAEAEDDEGGGGTGLALDPVVPRRREITGIGRTRPRRRLGTRRHRRGIGHDHHVLSGESVAYGVRGIGVRC
jgi:hypothetical protein